MNWIGLYTLIRRDMMRIIRVGIQTIVSPLISAGLYIFIFGSVIGSRIDLIAGIPYISFVFPGILMMNILSSSFMHSSNSMYFQRFIRSIEEVLVAPFTHVEMIIWLVTAGVLRGFLIGVGVLAIGSLFGAVSLVSGLWFIFYALSVAMIFSLLGILVGLWANSFEQLNVLNTFVIMPFTYLGGMFYSIHMLPEKVQILAHLNPFFYFVDGLRYSMTGVSEANAYAGFAIIGGLLVVLFGIVWWAFKTGWRIRS